MLEIVEADMTLAAMSVNMQNHGDQLVPVTHIKAEIELSAQELVMFSPTARGAWFDGSEPPKLRVMEAPGPYDITGSVKGAAVTIHYGLGDKSDMKFVGCDIDNYSLEPHNGGSVTFRCKIACYPGDTQLGNLYRGQRGKFSVSIQPAQAEMALDEKDDDDPKPKPRKSAKEAKEGAELH